MINIKDYEAYKQARQATEQAQPDDTAIYEQIYQYEQTRAYVAVLDAKRKKEQRYQKFVSRYSYEIKSGKMSVTMAQKGFKGENYEFYLRFLKEGGKK